MTKHPASQEKKEPEQSKPGMELPKPTPEQQEKLSKIQKELDTFKEKCLKTRTDITGMSLLPPLQPRPGETINPNEIHIFILIDDAKVEGLAKGDLIVKSTEETTKIAKEINENFKPQVMLITELKEACFDAKYDIIQMVATSALFYDKGLLSALKVAELHKNMAIKKFEKYVVSYIAVGSLFRGDAAPNDIDVAIVIDDTDVKKMSRFELRDKLRAIIINMGYEASQITGVKAQFHIQTYILTDFWESVKDANPVIFTMLRDGVPLYDRGVFMPWKLLLQMGRIKPSPEAIDMNMEVGDKLIDRTKQKLLSVVGEDLFYAVMNPTQAALMLYGIPPPTPKEAVKLMEEIYVKKEKLLEKKYVDILEKIRKTFKDIEHGELKEVSGKDIDKLLTDCKDYLERIKKFHKDLQEIIKAKKDFDAKKLSKQEVNKVRREAREYIRTILDILDRKRSLELNKSKLFFRYGDNKTGEITFLKDIAFIVKDTNKREEIWIAAIEKDASLQNLKKSDVNEYEKYIKSIKMPHEKILKIQTLESLRDIVGEEVEILWKA